MELKQYRFRKSGLSIFLYVLFFYIVFFTWVAIWRYENFSIGGSGDLIIFEQTIYNTLHGRFFYATGIGNQFGYHNSPILALLVPFAYIMPAPYVLYVFTVLSIAVSAIPVYLLAREQLKSETLAFLLGIAYLMLPAFVGQLYVSFHEINLVLPFLTFSFYYFVKERFYPFMAMFILGLMVKEDVALTLFMFSAYAIIKKRNAKWYISPSIISISWFLLSIKVVVPFFHKDLSYPMISYLSDLGSSFGEIIVNILSNPHSTLQRLLRHEKIFYLFVLLWPVGLILPFLSVEAIFIIPSLFMNMLAVSTRFTLERFALIDCQSTWCSAYTPRHMSLMASVFLMISVIYSLKRIGSIARKRKYVITAVFILVSLLLVRVGYSDRFVIFNLPLIHGRLPVTVIESVKKVLSQIPHQATVKADIEIAAHLYDRKEVYPSESPVEADYLVLLGIYETGDLLVNKDGNPIDANIRRKYNLMALEKGVALFKNTRLLR